MLSALRERLEVLTLAMRATAPCGVHIAAVEEAEAELLPDFGALGVDLGALAAGGSGGHGASNGGNSDSYAAV